MKRSAIQCVAGTVGAVLVVVGVVWTCRQLASPTQLNAAAPVPASSLKLSPASPFVSSSRNAKGAIPARGGDSRSRLAFVAAEEPATAPVASAAPEVDEPALSEPILASAPAPLGSLESFDSELLATDAVDEAFPTFATEDSAFVESPQALVAPPTALAGSPTEDSAVAFDALEGLAEESAELAPFDPVAPSSAPLPTPDPLETPPAIKSANELEDAAVASSTLVLAPPTVDASFASPAESPASSTSAPPSGSFAVPSVSASSTGRGVPGDKTLEGPQSAQIIVEKIVAEELQVDVEAIVVLSVQNVGNVPARGVVLREPLPNGANFASANPPVSPTANGELLWPAFDLEPGTKRTFEYRIVPTQEGEIGGVATVSFAVEASSRSRCVKPELSVEVAVPREAALGDNINFEIVVSNVGSGSATGVSLLETIPEGLYHPSGSTLNNELGTLKPGETKRLPLTLQCAAAGPTVNSLVVTADGGIEKRVESEIKILAPALELTIDGTATPYLERDAVYRLKVRNVGDAPAKDVKLVAELPSGTEFVSANNLGAYKADVRSVYWDLAELPVGTEGEIELTVKPIKIATSRLTFGGTGPNQLTAQVVQEVSIDGMPALSFNVKTANNPVEVGKEIEYEIQLVNSGTKASTNALLQVALPATMQVVSTDGPSQPTNRGGTLVFDKIREIPAKSTATFKVRATASEAGDCRVGFQISSDDLTPLVKEENTRVYR